MNIALNVLLLLHFYTPSLTDKTKNDLILLYKCCNYFPDIKEIKQKKIYIMNCILISYFAQCGRVELRKCR